MPASPHLLDALAARLPVWVFGAEEPRAQLALVRAMRALAQSPEMRGLGLTGAADGLAWWAWQRRPWRPEAAELLTDGPAAGLARDCQPEPPGARSDLEEALEAADVRLLTRALIPAVRESGPGPLLRAWPLLLALEETPAARALLDETPFPAEAEPMAARLRAEWAALCLPPEEALPVVRECTHPAFDPWRRWLEAHLLRGLGERDKAADLTESLCRDLPGHPHFPHLLHELRFPRRAPASLADGDAAAVLLYCWNKAELLSQTLDALAACELGEAHVALLDNGSTDDTWEVMNRFARRLGPDRVTLVQLPVNVGAPAARNWLLSLPEVRARRFAAFLDDDVLPPEDWLPKLLAAARDNPDASAIGCRIVAATPPASLQSADYHLFSPRPDAGEERIAVFDNASGQPDLGLFTYARPCLSVSGCCHLLRTSALEETGRFDVRFTPTQFDDLERDMRACLAGQPAFFEGSLAVPHVGHSSLAKSQSPTAVGNVLGNRVKLEGLFTDQQLRDLAEDDMRRAWADLRKKLDEL
ncbi:glycosyltransferase [Desulfohalovibrio reitneri]|uniref:glycosyltransferase n=1 Tax=Desulfohalovibrio reitneri TaxID=1307759 RepID=UPI00068CA1F4|nr:glycosyltransferase [Desulfohalovibrio reitneri]